MVTPQGHRHFASSLGSTPSGGQRLGVSLIRASYACVEILQRRLGQCGVIGAEVLTTLPFGLPLEPLAPSTPSHAHRSD
jgi:hypothetical protein